MAVGPSCYYIEDSKTVDLDEAARNLDVCCLTHFDFINSLSTKDKNSSICKQRRS